MNNPAPAGLMQLQELFQRFINVAVAIAFIALTITFFVAGVRFIISAGDPKATQAASAMMTQALIGLLFLVLAWLVLQLIEAFTGVNVTTFCFGFPPYCLNK